VSSSGWVLTNYEPALLLHPPAMTMQTPDNRPDLWNPRVIPDSSDLVLFERYSKDITHNANIQITPFPLVDQSDSHSLQLTTENNHLLDIRKGHNSVFHLLWKGEEAASMMKVEECFFIGPTMIQNGQNPMWLMLVKMQDFLEWLQEQTVKYIWFGSGK
jgi:hypothetical protein